MKRHALRASQPTKRSAVGPASFQPKSCNSKLGPVEFVHARPPFVSSTYVSIQATCPASCPFKSGGCYVLSGPAKGPARKLDEAACGHTSLEVIQDEVRRIDDAFGGGPVPQDGARGGRDLRLHVGGDVGSTQGARLLAGAARRWRARGGGTVWTFTHFWREVPRKAWGDAISVLASIESVEDVEEARRAGYPAALVVAKFPSGKAFPVAGSEVRAIPCPAETGYTTCIECRLCLDRDLLKMNRAIAFETHGSGARKANQALIHLRRDRFVPLHRHLARAPEVTKPGGTVTRPESSMASPTGVCS